MYDVLTFASSIVDNMEYMLSVIDPLLSTIMSFLDQDIASSFEL